MKKKLVTFLTIVLFLITLLEGLVREQGHPDSSTSQQTSIGSVSFLLGQTGIKGEDSLEWGEAKYRSDIVINDSIRTLKKSRCEITFISQQLLRVGELAAIQVTRLPGGGERVTMSAGEAWIKSLVRVNSKPFLVRTPTSVCSIRGTVYRLSTDSTYSRYRVYSGSISITPLDESGSPVGDTTYSVGAGNEILIVRDFDEFRRRQREKLDRFIQGEGARFEEFQRRQQEMLEAFRKVEERKFEAFKTLNITTGRYNAARDRELDWVRWNLERDRLFDRIGRNK